MTSESGYDKRKESLGVFEDENGYLRCKGRIRKAKIKFGTRFPLLVPTNNYFSALIVKAAHEKVYHNGVKETLAEVRSIYWMVKGRQFVKKTIRRCCLCKKLEGLAYPEPVTCDLPDFRVNPGRAFETSGVDFCGPVYIKQMYQKNGDMYKAYIAITTCATSRMVHLELTPDLTTSAYLRSQRRFISRRGFPKLMVSDNGRTFKGHELKRHNAIHGIKWRFNLPKAPWWGGMFERMVRSTKRCLKKAVTNRRLTYEELLTILNEVEAVINNRPLTYLDEDDLEQALTPSHLFCGRRTLDIPKEGEGVTASDVDSRDAVRRTRLVNSIVDYFWRRWSNEYLIELRENHKMKTKGKKLNIAEGDVVLVQEDGVKRNKWKLGRVEEVIVGGDGVIRGANVRTSCGDKIGNVSRPLQKLYPLEIANPCNEDKQEINFESVENDVQNADSVGDVFNEASDACTTENTDAGHESAYDESDHGKCSGSLGSLGDALGGGSGQTFDKHLDKLVSNATPLKSKRSAAIDGQLRRRINEFAAKSN